MNGKCKINRFQNAGIAFFANLLLKVEMIYKNQISKIASTVEHQKRKNYQNTVFPRGTHDEPYFWSFLCVDV